MTDEMRTPSAEELRAERWERGRAVAAGAVAELAEPMTTALGELLRDGDAARYALVIGDDTSGRIPARVAWRVLNELRRRRGLPRVNVDFLPGGGGRELASSLADTALERAAPRLVVKASGLRALVVTDAVDSGLSIRRMLAGLDDLGIPADALAVVRSPRWHDRAQPLPDQSRLYVGVERDQAPRVDGDHSISGLLKVPRLRVLTSEHVRPTAVSARVEANRLAEQIARTL